jgi:hypothetical protein
MAEAPPAEVLGMLVAAISRLSSVVTSLVPCVEAIETAVSAGQEGFRIFAKTLTDVTYELLVHPMDMIEDLKEQMENFTGIPPDQQNFIYAGMQLEPTKTIQHYGIQRDDTVHIVLRIRR